MGGPGSFAADVVRATARSHRWGIVPHDSHRNPVRVRQLATAPGRSLIDPTEDAETAHGKMSVCAPVLSSSLHGLIGADSQGLPCCWLNIQSHKAHQFAFSDDCLGAGRKPFDQVSRNMRGTCCARMRGQRRFARRNRGRIGWQERCWSGECAGADAAGGPLQRPTRPVQSRNRRGQGGQHPDHRVRGLV